jgi:hypothetical protein
MSPAAQTPVAHAPGSPGADLLALIGASTEAQIVELLPKLRRADLLLLKKALIPRGCDCDPVPLPCECGRVYYRDDEPATCPKCGDEPAWDPCEHQMARVLSLPLRAQMRLRDLLRPGRRPSGPSLPAKKTHALTQAELVTVYAQRQRAGEALWHPNDLIQLRPGSRRGSPVAKMLAQLERPIYRRAMWKKAGCPTDLPAEPSKNGDDMPGFIRLRKKTQEQAMVCSRCLAKIDGEKITLPHGAEVTLGYYEVAAGYWHKFAEPGEVLLCDACMWADPRYQTIYGVHR